MALSDFHKKIKNNHAVALIGEDHKGKWANTPAAAKAVDEVVEFFIAKNSPITCWYEGEMRGGSPSFQAFVKHLAKKYPKQKIVERSWEPPARTVMNREERLAVSLLGQDAPAFKRYLGRGIFLDELERSKKWYTISTDNFTKKEIINLVSKGIYKDDYLDLLSQPITDAVLDDWFNLREEAFEDTTSKLYQIVSKPNEKRQDKLYALMKQESGIYLIGESHISWMKSRNRLP
jgi:hypothetical protein